MDKQGLLLCARYSAAPNFFGYCGPDENLSLIDHLKEKRGDKEVKQILSEFETLYLNLKLIAFENKISDPFNNRVVEAYWIGNSLLNNIKNIDYVSLLKERFKLEKKIGNEKFSELKLKVLSNRLLPHHSFHVFNIFKRTGNMIINHSLETMDECRIGWGKICQMLDVKFKIVVEYKPLIIKKGKLDVGLISKRKLTVDYKGKSFIKNLKVGDWVSFHWGFVCDILTPKQVNNLEFYTQKAINFYNQ